MIFETVPGLDLEIAVFSGSKSSSINLKRNENETQLAEVQVHNKYPVQEYKKRLRKT